MSERLEVVKTYKLFIDGKFPRSESGRTIELVGGPGDKGAAKARGETAERGRPIVLAHVCRASRKDLRDAVSAARKALPGWSAATAYVRGQILYRMAEMVEGKRDEFARVLAGSGRAGRPRAGSARGALGGVAEVQASIDRLVSYAGWADKFSQVLGCNNPVAGPYYNFTVPEPTGVVAVVAPGEPGLLGLVSLVAPALCAGNTVVALAGEGAAGSLAGVLLAEVAATSDVPGGVLNVLTGVTEELAPVIASHRDIDAVHAGGVSGEVAAILRGGAAENLKRVVIRTGASRPAGAAGRAGAARTAGVALGGTPDWYDDESCQSPWWIEPLVNFKTIWHPSAT